MQRVLVENLALLLGSDAVVASPLGARVAAAYRLRGGGAQPATPGPGGLTLEAVWMVTRPGAAQALLVRRTDAAGALPDPARTPWRRPTAGSWRPSPGRSRGSLAPSIHLESLSRLRRSPASRASSSMVRAVSAMEAASSVVAEALRSVKPRVTAMACPPPRGPGLDLQGPGDGLHLLGVSRTSCSMEARLRATAATASPPASHPLVAFLDQAVDLPGRVGAALGQLADLVGHHREALAVLAGLGRLDGGVEAQQVGLPGDLRDHRGDPRDLGGALLDGGHGLGGLPGAAQPFPARLEGALGQALRRAGALPGLLDRAGHAGQGGGGAFHRLPLLVGAAADLAGGRNSSAPRWRPVRWRSRRSARRSGPSPGCPRAAARWPGSGFG